MALSGTPVAAATGGGVLAALAFGLALAVGLVPSPLTGYAAC